MNPITGEDIVAYGKNLKATNPSISAEDLKKALLLKFVGGKELPAGCLPGPPFGNHLANLWIVFNSLRKMVTRDKVKLEAIQKQIDAAIEKVMTKNLK